MYCVEGCLVYCVGGCQVYCVGGCLVYTVHKFVRCTLFKVFRYTGGVQSNVNSDCQVYLSEMLTCLLWVRLSGVWCCLSGAVEVSYRSSNMYNLIITLSRILANLADSQTQVKPMHIITLVLIIVTTNKLTIFEAESSATWNNGILPCLPWLHSYDRYRSLWVGE